MADSKRKGGREGWELKEMDFSTGGRCGFGSPQVHRQTTVIRRMETPEDGHGGTQAKAQRVQRSVPRAPTRTIVN